MAAATTASEKANDGFVPITELATKEKQTWEGPTRALRDIYHHLRGIPERARRRPR